MRAGGTTRPAACLLFNFMASYLLHELPVAPVMPRGMQDSAQMQNERQMPPHAGGAGRQRLNGTARGQTDRLSGIAQSQAAIKQRLH